MRITKTTKKVSRMSWGALIAGVLCAGMFVAEAATPPVTDGLFLHLNGSSAVVDSQGRVGTWTNLAMGAGVSGDLTQPTDWRRPTLGVAVNGLRTLRFKRPSGQCMFVAGDSTWDRPSDSAWTVFVAFAPGSISTNDLARDLFCAGYKNFDGSANIVDAAATAVRIFLRSRIPNEPGKRYVTANGRNSSGTFRWAQVDADDMVADKWEVVCGRWNSAPPRDGNGSH